MVSPPWSGQDESFGDAGKGHLLLHPVEDAGGCSTRSGPGEPSPVHASTLTARPTQPGQEPKAPSRAKTTVAAACQAMCQRAISAVYQPAKKLGTTRRGRRGGRKAFRTRTAPTRLTARYTHAHAMAPSSLKMGRWRTPRGERPQAVRGAANRQTRAKLIMEQLTGLDATSYTLETPSLHMHVSMAAMFDPATVPGGYSFDKLRDLVGSRLSSSPRSFAVGWSRFPSALGHPYWVDDSSFDIEYHIRRAPCPAPGGVEELAEFVGDVCSRQLDRSKPLWEMYIVEGLHGGQIAMVTRSTTAPSTGCRVRSCSRSCSTSSPSHRPARPETPDTSVRRTHPL